ncbi:hypothetical protein CEXT_8051, partial [Caerostris extrusa]
MIKSLSIDISGVSSDLSEILTCFVKISDKYLSIGKTVDQNVFQSCSKRAVREKYVNTRDAADSVFPVATLNNYISDVLVDQ